jgi:hypothetical protein
MPVREESSSFLKKRTKKLLLSSKRASRGQYVTQQSKSFLFLFFKKELLPCFAAPVGVAKPMMFPVTTKPL